MAFGALPDASKSRVLAERDFFSFDNTFVLNLVALGISGIFFIAKWRSSGFKTHGSNKLSERILLSLSLAALCWLGIGLLIPVLA